jgi:hypothetical protein
MLFKTMKSKKKDSKSNRNPVQFGVAEYSLRPHNNGKMICHSTGEIVEQGTAIERGRGTWIEFKPTE